MSSPTTYPMAAPPVAPPSPPPSGLSVSRDASTEAAEPVSSGAAATSASADPAVPSASAPQPPPASFRHTRSPEYHLGTPYNAHADTPAAAAAAVQANAAPAGPPVPLDATRPNGATPSGGAGGGSAVAAATSAAAAVAAGAGCAAAVGGGSGSAGEPGASGATDMGDGASGKVDGGKKKKKKKKPLEVLLGSCLNPTEAGANADAVTVTTDSSSVVNPQAEVPPPTSAGAGGSPDGTPAADVDAVADAEAEAAGEATAVAEAEADADTAPGADATPTEPTSLAPASSGVHGGSAIDMDGHPGWHDISRCNATPSAPPSAHAAVLSSAVAEGDRVSAAAAPSASSTRAAVAPPLVPDSDAMPVGDAVKTEISGWRNVVGSREMVGEEAAAAGREGPQHDVRACGMTPAAPAECHHRLRAGGRAGVGGADGGMVGTMDAVATPKEPLMAVGLNGERRLVGAPTSIPRGRALRGGGFGHDIQSCLVGPASRMSGSRDLPGGSVGGSAAAAAAAAAVAAARYRPEPQRPVQDVFHSSGVCDLDSLLPQYDALSEARVRSKEEEEDNVDLCESMMKLGVEAQPLSIPRQVNAVPRNQGNGVQGYVVIRMDRIKQTMRGFGFSNAFYTSFWHSHPNRDEIYYRLFHDLRPSILRFRNVYDLGPGSEGEMNADVTFLNSARTILGYTPEVLLSSWTPPAHLKQNRQLNAGTPTAVLDKDHRGWFKYYEFCQWWVQSIRAYERLGIKPQWISMQNEPDYSPPSHPGCLFGARETFNTPGYYRAASELRDHFRKNFSPAPKMIGPECFAMDAYLSEMPYAGGEIFAAMANHPYASGTRDNPWSYQASFNRARVIAEKKQMADVFQTEFAFLGKHRYQDPLRLAIVIHNALTVGNCSMYLLWDGLWASNADNDEGSLMLIDNPFKPGRGHWHNDKGYRILHSFWWYMHFTRTIRPGYRRAQVDIFIKDVLASAWTGPNGQMSIIMINVGRTQAYLTMRDMPEWMKTQNTDIFYSTLDKGFTYAGRLQGDNVSLLPRSITTVFSYQPS